jgi:hypothetical protein
MKTITKQSTMHERLQCLYGDEIYEIDTAVVEVERILCCMDDVNDNIREGFFALEKRLDRIEGSLAKLAASSRPRIGRKRMRST